MEPMYIKNKKSDIDTLYLHALGMLHLLWHRRPIKLYRFEAAAARRSTEMGLLVEAITHHRLKPDPSIFFWVVVVGVHWSFLHNLIEGRNPPYGLCMWVELLTPFFSIGEGYRSDLIQRDPTNRFWKSFFGFARTVWHFGPLCSLPSDLWCLGALSGITAWGLCPGSQHQPYAIPPNRH